MSINNLFEKGNKFFLAQNHGFNEKGSGYANLTDTKNFLITNDIPSNKIINCNPEKQKITKFKFDLLIFYLQWVLIIHVMNIQILF